MTEKKDGTEKRQRPTKKAPPKKDLYVSPDGRSRPKKIERQINEAFAIAFRGAVGTTVKHYLRSISTNEVLPPGTDANTIVYKEGARWLMGIIEMRINYGEDKKP